MAASERRIHVAAAAVVLGALALVDEIGRVAMARRWLLDAGASALVPVGFAVAAVTARLAWNHASPLALTWILLGGSVVVVGGAWATWMAFAMAGAWLTVVVAVLTGAAALGAILGSAGRSLWAPAMRLGAVGYFASPFRLVPLLAAFGAWYVLRAQVSFLVASTLTALALTAVAAIAEPRLVELHASTRRFARSTAWAPAVLALLHALLALPARAHSPRGEALQYPDPIVAAFEGDRRYVVTSSPSGFELFAEQQLIASSLDGHRHAEALALPALAAAPAARRVALLGGGTGMIERVLLDAPGLTDIVVVTPEAILVERCRTMAWLRARTRGALSDPRLRWIFEEPLPWLLGSEDTFDVIVVDAGAPADHRTGKWYTVHALTGLARRLGATGVVALPAGSAQAAPEAFASIVATARTSGLVATPYHVPIVSLGEASFLLMTVQRELPTPTLRRAGAFLNPATLESVFVVALDQRVGPEQPSRLYDQIAVERFAAETQTR